MIVYKVLGGSRLYGTSTETSDHDTQAADVPNNPRKLFCVGCNWMEGKQALVDGNDIRVHDLRYFMYLAMRGQTSFLESMFVKPEHILELHPCLGQKSKEYLSKTNKETGEVYSVKSVTTRRLYGIISELRENILTGQMNVVGPAYGYAESELRTAFGETTGDLGVRRKESLSEFGYSPKNAHHGLRITMQTLHCLKTGQYSPYVMDHTSAKKLTGIDDWLGYLMSVKTGQIPAAEIRHCFETLITELSQYHLGKTKTPKQSALPFPNSSERVAAVNELTAEATWSAAVSKSWLVSNIGR